MTTGVFDSGPIDITKSFNSVPVQGQNHLLCQHVSREESEADALIHRLLSASIQIQNLLLSFSFKNNNNNFIHLSSHYLTVSFSSTCIRITGKRSLLSTSLILEKENQIPTDRFYPQESDLHPAPSRPSLTRAIWSLPLLYLRPPSQLSISLFILTEGCSFNYCPP